MRKARAQINIDKLKVCFRANEYLTNTLIDEFNLNGNRDRSETDHIIEFPDFRLVCVDNNDDKMSVAIDILMDDKRHRLGCYEFSLNGKYKPYTFFTAENRALYTDFLPWLPHKNSIIGLLEDISASIGLYVNNITCVELALDTNLNILQSVKRAIRNYQDIEMIYCGRKVTNPNRKIENYTVTYGGSRKRLYSNRPTIRLAQVDGVEIKVYNKTAEMQEATPEKLNYIPQWNGTGRQNIYRAEVTVRNPDISAFCDASGTDREEVLFRLQSEEWRASLWLWAANRVLRFRNKHTGEAIDLLDILSL